MKQITIAIFTLCIVVLSACTTNNAEKRAAEIRSEIVDNVKNSVLPFWMNHTTAPDGGFHGAVSRNGTPRVEAPRGGVLNARILWSFAAAYRTFGNPEYLQLANRSMRYFLDTFIDREHDGVYWLVKADGEMLNPAKFAYALTYGIYGLAEHYLATGNEESLREAFKLYETLETKARDPQHDGYLETFTREWTEPTAYDNNAPKTMNAHLHVLEAYTLLYQCRKDEKLKERLTYCFDLFAEQLYDSDRKHFNLFFDKEWNSLEMADSYGHDVETGWLLCEAARTLNDPARIKKAEEIALEVTDICLQEGMDEKGYMAYEKKNGQRSKQASWWGQVETIIACINAWQISGEEKYLNAAETVWTFVKEKMIDTEYGEWFSDCFDGEPRKEGTKASMWRCPYHTVRLGVEMHKRIKEVKN